MELIKKWSENYVEAGCDEVGRGCLCGPVVAAAVILDEKKIHAQIQQNKSKAPKPEGKFQKRMREMMEKAQEQQKMQEEQRKKMNKK